VKRLSKIITAVGVLLIAVVVACVAVLNSLDFNEYRTLIAEQVKSATGRDLVINGNLNLHISFNPSLAVDGVTFANAEWGSNPQMASMDSFAAEVSLLPLLSGDIQVKRIVLQGLNVLLETNSSGAANWDFSSGETDTSSQDSGGETSLPVVHSIQIRDVKVTYRDGTSGDVQDISLDVLELASDGASSPMKMLLETVYNQESIKISGTLGSIDSLSDNKIFPVKLDIEALGADISIDGTVGEPRNAKGLNLGFDIKSDNIASVATRGLTMAGVDGGSPLPAKPFSASGAIRDGDNTWTVDGLALKIGGSDVAGNVAVNMNGKRPNISADLSSTLFDLADVTVEAKGSAEAASSPDDGRVFPNDPLPLEGMKSTDAVIAFKGKTVNADGLLFTDVEVELALKNARLDVSPFGLTFAGGRIGGDVTLDGSSSMAKLSMSVEGKQVDYGQILKDMAGDESLRGKLDMAIQINGSGASVRALMAGLNGNVRVQSENGFIDSGALAFATGPLTALFEGDDAKTLRCAVFNFDIVKGQATSKAAVLETGGLSIVGKGGIDLSEEKLALYFDPRAKNTSFATIAEIGINVGGTLKEPSVSPDMGDVAVEAVGIAAGIATGGLSTIVGMAVDTSSGVDQTDYCALALAGKSLKPDTPASSSGGDASSNVPSEPAKQEGENGIGGVLQGIFGN